jgi:2-amino-4-hydroxy-6-hydroxymethyldihydropteridine diphosphokinase
VSAPARRAFVGLGSNLGDRLAHLERGAELLAVGGDVVRASSVYETDPVGGPEQGPYLNAVVELSTTDGPRQILERCRAVERAAGRVRTVRFGPRTLDADVLLVGDQAVDEADLVVPHPRMYERRFVLVPLAELAPELVPAAMLEGVVGEVRRVGTLTRFTTSVTNPDR